MLENFQTRLEQTSLNHLLLARDERTQDHDLAFAARERAVRLSTKALQRWRLGADPCSASSAAFVFGTSTYIGILENQGELVAMYSIVNIHNRRTMKHNSRIHVLSPIGHAKRALAQSRPGGAFETPDETVKPFKACACKVLTTWQNAHTTHLRSIDSGQISIDFVNAIDRECSRERTWRPILKTDRTEYGESVLHSSAARSLS